MDVSRDAQHDLEDRIISQNHMSSIEKLTEIFKKFPGVGPRQARRFVYYLLTRNKGAIEEIVRNIGELDNEVIKCDLCQRYYVNRGNAVHASTCAICLNTNRDQNILMIVPRDVDLDNMERSRAFNGLYFVLGGAVPILEENPQNFIRQSELIQRVENLMHSDNAGGLREIIIAVSANPEGENTHYHLNNVLTDVIEKVSALTPVTAKPRITTLGRGLSTGTELEYSDAETIKSALQNRR
jgi:recombination protein RecR